MSTYRSGSMVGASLASTLVVAAALAQDAQLNQLEEIVVTGTNIRDSAVIGSVVQTIDAESVAKSGKATVAELLREMPVNFAGGVAKDDNNRSGSDATSGGANLTGGAGVNLRGLGALSTLVLVNGRRVAVSGQFGDFVDVSNIPAAAIERIEVLPDGASAVYGSDAVGGVVNFILKRDLDGLHTLARIGTTTQGGGEELQASAAWGNRWDSGRVVLGYEYNKRGNVTAADRDMTGDQSAQGGVNWPRYTRRVGTAANIFSAGANFNGNVAYTVPQGPGVGLTVGQLTPVTDGVGNNTSNPWEKWDILPEMSRHSLFFTADQRINERATLYGSGRFTRRDGVYQIGYVDILGNVPVTSPYYIPGTSNNFSVLVDDFVAQRDVSVESLGAEMGLRFDLGRDWVLDISASHSREKQRRKSMIERDANIENVLLSGVNTVAAPNAVTCSLSGLTSANIGSIANPTAAQQYCAALNYTTFNPYSTEPLPQAVLNQIIGYENLLFNSRVTQGTAQVDGTLFDLPGGPLKAAIGLDRREEFIDGELNFNYRSIRPLSQPYGATRRTVNSAYAELAVPIVGRNNALSGVRALDLSLAVRHEDSSGLGDFTTTNPKFGIRFKPLDSLTFHGSYGTSFHAPPMRFSYNGPQPVPGGNAIFSTPAFWSAPCDTTLVDLNGFSGTIGSSTESCTFNALIVSGGAGPGLKPEKADTWTLGVEFAPERLPGLHLSASYYNLELSDRLVRITQSILPGILANYFATGTSSYMGNLDFRPDLATVQALYADPRFIGHTGPGTPITNPADIAGIIYATQMNLASLHTDGLDLAARYAWDTGLGNFELFANGTVVLSYEIQGAPGESFVSKLGLYESLGNPVKFRSKQGISFTRGGFSTIATVNYTDDYQCVAGCYVPGVNGVPVLNTQPVKIDSWVTLDLQLGYNFEQATGLLAGAGVRLSVNNVFDEDAPFIDTGTPSVSSGAPEPYDASNATIIGRVVSLTFTKAF